MESSNEPHLDDETKPKTIKHYKKKRRRRGGVKSVKSKHVSKDFKVYIVNIRGANSKKVSLKSIIDDPQVDPDMINLVETNLKKSSKLDIDGYKCFNRNRQNKHMGGVATLVKEEDLKDTLKVSEGPSDNEYLVTRHSQFHVPINIIVVYGEQESRSKCDEIQRKWDEVMEEVKKIEARDEACIVLGDFNKAVGNIIPGNHEKVSSGGNLVRKFLENDKYILVNSSTKAKNGPFTRYDPSAPDDVTKKSALDLVIISKNLEIYMKEMIIDKNLSWTPFRSKPKSKDLVYSDHYAIILSFNGIQVSNKVNVRNGVRETHWNTNKKDGWKNYFQETNMNRVLDKVCSSEGVHPNVMMKRIDKEVTNVKYKVFGKVSGKRKKTTVGKVKALQAKKHHFNKVLIGNELKKKIEVIDKDLKKAVDEVQKRDMQTEITKLQRIKATKGTSAAVFNLRGGILGSSKSSSDPISIVDPSSGLPIMSPVQIKKVTLEYCVKLLTNRKPRDSYVEVLKKKEMLHKLRMHEQIPNDCDELTLDMFNSTLRFLARKNGEKYKFIMKGGQSLKNAIFQLFLSVWITEEIPRVWHDSRLVQLWKGKGVEGDLQNTRFIHIKSEFQKFFVQIVISQAKGNIYDNMSKYQIATKPGHRASEHLYAVKSLMGNILKEKKVIIVTMWDLKSFFDTENLLDVMAELYKKNVKGKIYRLLYKLNENIRITVKTPVGETESADTESGVGQGTSEGAIISSCSVDGGVKEFFSDNEDSDIDSEEKDEEDDYTPDLFHPIIFQDDIFKASEDIKSANDANVRMVKLVESKLLSLNLDKSIYLVIGDKRARKNILKKLETNPIVIDDHEMKYSESGKYLGDKLGPNLSSSVSETVKMRVGLASCAIYEIRAVVDDRRAETLASLPTAFMIWEMAVIPMLLNNAEVWVGMNKRTLKELDKLQLKFLRLILAVGTGCPIPMLYAETGTMLMSNRVLLRKLLFLHHVATLSPNTLARQVYERECRQDPLTSGVTLVRECQTYLTEFGIHDIQSYTKYQIKGILRKKIFLKNKCELIQMSEKYKKIDTASFSCESFQMKQYFKELNLQQSCLQFKLNSKMTPKIASNFHCDPKYCEMNYLCVGCSVRRDSEDHVTRCERYSDLRQNLNLDVQKDLLTFFQLVIDRRTAEEQTQ